MLNKPYLALAFLLLPCVASRGKDWPRFRGPTGQGISSEADVPLTWGEGQNVAWKTPIPGEGWSSPVVWGGRVFLTATTDAGAGCHVLCFDGDGGKLLWDKEVLRQTPGRKEGKNSYATPTPVTDGTHVWAFFSAGGCACLRVAGEVAWTNQEIHFYSRHGLGASPILHEDLLIMPFDGSSRGADEHLGWTKPWEEAFIVAFDKGTGKEKWRAKRGLSRQAHITPMVMDVDGGPQLVSAAGDVIEGFDLQNGELIWSIHSRGEGVVPTPVFGEGLLFTSSGFEAEMLRAVRVGGRGDMTAKAIAWERKGSVPMIPSLLYAGGKLFTVKEDGRAQCLEAKTGNVIWQKKLGGNYSASPVWACGRVYFLAEDGTTTVIDAAANEFKVLARNTLGPVEGACQASPAVSGGRIFIRTAKHLICIAGGEK